MPVKPWKKLSESIVHRNPYWTYKRDAIELPSGKPGEYHYVHTNGSSMVVPVAGDGALLLVNQYRYLPGRESAEFPCGSMKDGSTHDETARQELAEETGYEAGVLIPAGEFNPYNGVTDEMCRVYVARDLSFVGGTPDETEEFELLRLTPAEVEAQKIIGHTNTTMTELYGHLVKGKDQEAVEKLPDWERKESSRAPISPVR